MIYAIDWNRSSESPVSNHQWGCLVLDYSLNNLERQFYQQIKTICCLGNKQSWNLIKTSLAKLKICFRLVKWRIGYHHPQFTPNFRVCPIIGSLDPPPPPPLKSVQNNLTWKLCKTNIYFCVRHIFACAMYLHTCALCKEQPYLGYIRWNTRACMRYANIT